ncbi:MAG: hypothetical protein AAFU03_11570, partial [Bacteroidota bacterium]
IPASQLLPSAHSNKISTEKVEKVEKPPQNPVSNNKREEGDICSFAANASPMPSMVQARILAINVGQGKPDSLTGTNREMK